MGIEHQIREWLYRDEEILYDTKTDDLTVNNEKPYRGVITNKRTILATQNKVHYIYHDLVASMTFQRKIHYWLLGLALALFIFGGSILNSQMNSIFQGIMPTNPLAYVLFGGGGIAIVVFFLRPQTLEIYSAGNKTKIQDQGSKIKYFSTLSATIGTGILSICVVLHF